MATASAPREPGEHVDLINSLTALMAIGGEIVADPSMPADVHEFAAGVLPILQSLDWAPERAVQAMGGERFAPAADLVDVRSEEEPAVFEKPPIWFN